MFNKNKPVIASPGIKRKILKAIANNNEVAHFGSMFSGCDFVQLPSDNYTVWSSQKGDVTMMVWFQEDGTSYAKVQCW